MTDDDEIPFAIGEYPPLPPMSPLAKFSATMRSVEKAMREIRQTMIKPAKG